MSTSMIRRSASSRRFDGTARALAVAGLVAAAGFVAVLVAVGLLDDGYSQRSEGISALGSRESDTAGLMILGFLLLGSIALTSGAALLRSLPGKAGEAAGVLVVLAGALTVACGFVRQDCSTLQQACLDRESADQVSGAHVLHNLMALPLFASLVIAGFLIASALRRDARWAYLSRPVRIAAALAAGSFVWFGSAAYGDNGGLVQRLMVLLTFGIPLAVAVRVTSAGSREHTLR